MPATLVPDQLTPLSRSDVIAAACGAYVACFGDVPTAECLAVFAAQAILETGGKSIHNNNPGNRKRPKDWTGNYTRFGCDERFQPEIAARYLARAKARADGSGKPDVVRTSINHDGTWTLYFWPDHPVTEFVAFDTPAAGFADWLALIALTDRYAQAWLCARAGDAAGFVDGLHAGGYFTAALDTYRRAVVSIAASILPACKALVAGLTPALDPELVARVDAQVATALWEGRYAHAPGRDA